MLFDVMSLIFKGPLYGVFIHVKKAHHKLKNLQTKEESYINFFNILNKFNKANYTIHGKSLENKGPWANFT